MQIPIFLCIENPPECAWPQRVDFAQWCGSASHALVSIPELAWLLSALGSLLRSQPCGSQAFPVTNDRACQPAGRQESSAGERWQMKGWLGANVTPSRG